MREMSSTERARCRHPLRLWTITKLISLILLFLIFIPPASSQQRRVMACSFPDWDCGQSYKGEALPGYVKRVYYLSAYGGNDIRNDGLSRERPWRTLERALAVASERPKEEVEFRMAAGDYGDLDLELTNFPSRNATGAWVMFVAEHLASLSRVRVRDVSDAKLVLRGLMIKDTFSGTSGGGHNLVEIINSSQVRLANCFVRPPLDDDLFWANRNAVPQGFHALDSRDVLIQKSTISGGSHGVVFEGGEELYVWDSDVGYQYGDAVVVNSASDVGVEGCFIHDCGGDADGSVANGAEDSTSLDGVKISASAGRSANVQLRHNTFRNMNGRHMCAVSDGADPSWKISNLEIVGNVVEPRVNDDSVDLPSIQMDGVADFLMQKNTVASKGKVLVGPSCSGVIRENILTNLDITDDARLKGGKSDFNVISVATMSSSRGSPNAAQLGVNSATGAVTTYANPSESDFSPTTTEACAGGSDGRESGAVPCKPCQWRSSVEHDDGAAPVALFGIHPLQLKTDQEFGLYPAASTACGDDESVLLEKLIWTMSNGDGFTSSIVNRVGDDGSVEQVLLPTYTSFESPGEYSITLTAMDSNGAKSKPCTRHVTVI